MKQVVKRSGCYIIYLWKILTIIIRRIYFMEKNLFRYFSLLLVSFSITTFGQSKLAEKAYCAENKTELANENINSKDIYNLRIKTGEALVNASTAHDVFKSDVINNKYKVEIEFDCKDGFNPDNYIVTGTDNSIAGTISEDKPYTLTADLREGENTVRILDKSSNQLIYEFDINYKNIKVNGLDNVVKVGDASKLEAVIDGEVYDNVKWKSSNNDNVVVSENGELTAVQNGIASVIGTVYDQSGKNIIGNVDIEFNISGEGVSGWVKNADKWYYVNPDSKEIVHGWFKDKEDWYYFNEDGSLYTGWLQQNGAWYYLKHTGNMAIGWVKDDGNWYYCDTNGIMKTGWFKDHGNWYYFNNDGKMQIGDLLINGSVYKFNSHGELQLG